MGRGKKTKYLEYEANGKNITFIVDFQPVDEGNSLALVGSGDSLGNWQKPLIMTKIGFRSWSLDIEPDILPEYFEFKFVVVAPDGKIVLWEEGDNRIFDTPCLKNCINRSIFRGDYSWRCAGVAVPLFSLRRKNGWGVGEFTDMAALADWCVETNQKIIQILPINDTSAYLNYLDSYPYRAISIYALNPIYIDVEKVGNVNDLDLKNEYQQKRLELDSLTKIDYCNVLKLKLEILKKFYLEQKNSNFYKDIFDDIADFKQKNSWLFPYAAFRTLMDIYSTADFACWEEFAVFDKKKIEKFIKDNKEQVDFYIFIQYHLFRQFNEARLYLKAKNILLKGDLPIGIGALSVEAWQYPEMFNLGKQAGAPPDDFSDRGQCWGFPTYNWENMSKNGYMWWKERLLFMSLLFDAFRIDHILGFFRIWELPVEIDNGLVGVFNPSMPLSLDELKTRNLWFDGKYVLASNCLSDLHKMEEDDVENVIFIEDCYSPLHYHFRINVQKTQAYRNLPQETRLIVDKYYNDYFYSCHNDFWKQNGEAKLSELLSDNTMLVCGEDLGMIPQTVPEVMSRLNILSLEIIRMPKKEGLEFVNLDDMPYNSVVSSGTHDTSTLRMWWAENREKTEKFYNQFLGMEGNAPKNCSEEIIKKILSSLFKSNSMMAIIPIQDYFAMDKTVARKDYMEERINNPENAKNVWNYRMHLTIEELLKKRKFKESLKNLILENRR